VTICTSMIAMTRPAHIANTPIHCNRPVRAALH
jgi:hypothetical protein